MDRPLGATQKALLSCFGKPPMAHAAWYAECGWCWDGPGSTMKVLDSLVKRGLLVRHESLVIEGTNWEDEKWSKLVGPYYHKEEQAESCPECKGRGKDNR